MDSGLQKNIVSVAQVSLLTIFSTYSFFFARNIDSIGNSTLLAMAFICLLTLSFVKSDLCFAKSSLRYLSVFFFLCILTIILPIWPNTENNWTYSAACKCILGLSIVLIFKIQGSNWVKRTTWIIFLSLCLLMILQNNGFNIKEILNTSSFNCALGDWNEKHHTFWLVILLWPTMYFIKDSPQYNKFITILFFLFALFSSYSESAKVAIIFSTIVFLLSKSRPVVSWAIVYWALLLYILLFPFVLQIMPIADLDSAYDRLYIRFLLWEVSSNIIVDELIFGRGFGSTLSLNIIPFLPEFHSSAREWLYLSKTFPGNHPHNFVALIWIEFGLIGALMLTFFLYKFNRFITKTIKHSDSAPYIISIITTVVILFSCSWSIWQTDVVLTYIMFVASLNFLITYENHKN